MIFMSSTNSFTDRVSLHRVCKLYSLFVLQLGMHKISAVNVCKCLCVCESLCCTFPNPLLSTPFPTLCISPMHVFVIYRFPGTFQLNKLTAGYRLRRPHGRSKPSPRCVPVCVRVCVEIFQKLAYLTGSLYVAHAL